MPVLKSIKNAIRRIFAVQRLAEEGAAGGARKLIQDQLEMLKKRSSPPPESGGKTTG